MLHYRYIDVSLRHMFRLLPLEAPWRIKSHIIKGLWLQATDSDKIYSYCSSKMTPTVKKSSSQESGHINVSRPLHYC